MQPDLPWNVAGIPPEAREAARAAARREGLSVGEWLTRRILRTFTDAAEAQAQEAPRESWRSANMGNAGQRSDTGSAASRETDDMLARVSRSETEAQIAGRRIEDQLRGLTRRIDAAERSQSENSRAMTKAATEINIVAREQAQAFDQLGAHVSGLSERIERVERVPANDGLRDAVRGLHQGLSRVADQIAETANQSATQIASLAGNVESVAGKLMAARDEAEQTSKSLSSRIASIEDRVRQAERAAHSSASAMEKTLETIESGAATRRIEEAEVQRQARTLGQLGDLVENLAAKVSSNEAHVADTMARLEDNLIKLEAQSAETTVDRKLQGIEHALSDIASRLETTERSAAGTVGTVEENLKSLTQRVDAADKRQRDAVAELRAAVKAAAGRLEVVDPVPAAPPPPAPPPVQQAAPPPPVASFDLPPFPDVPPASFQQPGAPLPPPLSDPPPAFSADPSLGGAHAFGADTFAATAVQQASAAGTDSYLSAARRAARAASTEAQQTRAQGFTWGFTGASPEQAPAKSNTRFLLVGGIALIAVLAVVAGAMLSRNLIGAQQTALPQPFRAQPPIQSTQPAPPAPATQSSSDVTPATDDTGAETNDNVPGSPRLPAPHRHAAAVATHPAPPIAAPTTKVASAPANPPATNGLPAAQPSPQASLFDRMTALANSGNAKAEMLLGLKYLDGDGVPVNEAEAAKWLERAATQNDAIAAYRLGTLYERGHGVPTDATKAVHWYETAARLGNRKAMHNLAVAYAQGMGVPKDPVQAAQWFTRAADLGLVDSQFNLAVLYERGMGVPQNLSDAYKWYAIASALGDSESKARIDVLSTQLAPADRAAAQRAADAFKPEPMDRNANIPPDPATLFG